MKSIVILGSTGSIGTQTLDVIRNNPVGFKVEGLACGENINLLTEQIDEFRPSVVSVSTKEKKDELGSTLLKSIGAEAKPEILCGDDGLLKISGMGADILVNALMGIKGLKPTLVGIDSGSDIALANKETLVAGGEIVMKRAAEKDVKILPVDSEHSAIFQCLEGERINAANVKRGKTLRKIILTASGGPFRGWSKDMLSEITPEMALRHPNWKMGKKITIDSATMMNKGLEIIEAMHLFDVDVDDIQVVVHPQSIVHSAVEFVDSAILAQLGSPDMRIPISVALGYPDRMEGNWESLDLFGSAGTLTFEKPDSEVFQCLDIAIRAAKKGGTYPAAMNGSNEVLVDAFLDNQISFTDIPEIIDRVMRDLEGDFSVPHKIGCVEDVFYADSWAREKTREYVLGLKKKEGI